MPTNSGLPTGSKTTAEYLALNHELFAERAEILKSEMKLEVQLKELQSPELEKKLRRTQQMLERVTSKIVEANKGLVVNRVSRFTKKANADQRDEYMAAGMAGLIEVIGTYDVAHDNFAAWATWPVMRAVLDAVHGLEHETLSERDFAKRAAVQEALGHFEQDAGGAGPSIEQIADRAGASSAQVERILLSMSSQGINKTWGTKLSAKPSVSEFEDPAVRVSNSHVGLADHVSDDVPDSPFSAERRGIPLLGCEVSRYSSRAWRSSCTSIQKSVVAGMNCPFVQDADVGSCIKRCG